MGNGPHGGSDRDRKYDCNRTIDDRRWTAPSIVHRLSSIVQSNEEGDASMAQEQQQVRFLAWDACYNARELGGYPTEGGGRVRWKALVRADNLHRLTPEGQAALRGYGVRTIIDLRLEHELESHPNPFAAQKGPDAPSYLNLPFHDVETGAAIDAAESGENAYIILVERSKTLIAAVIKAI